MARAAIPLVVSSPVNGSAVAGATVTITKTSDASNASIYTARTGGGTTGTNVVTSDANGRCTSGGNELYLEQGTYTFVISGPGLTSTPIIREVVAGDGIVETFPVGGMLFWPGPNLPTGFLRCDASEISRTTYAALFAAITQTQQGTLINGVNTVTGLTDTSRMKAGDPVEGTGIQAGTTILAVTGGTSLTLSLTANAGGAQTLRFFPHGKAATTTFTLPDMRQRTAVGKSAAGVGVNFGEVGGVTTVTLTDLESGVNRNGVAASGGSHSHNIHTEQFGSPTAANFTNLILQDSGVGRQFDTNTSTDPGGAHTHTFTQRNADSAHQNMPPYLAADWIIRHGIQ
jgi:microcystin-dependent protein